MNGTFFSERAISCATGGSPDGTNGCLPCARYAKAKERTKPDGTHKGRRRPCQDISADPFRRPGRSLPPPGPPASLSPFRCCYYFGKSENPGLDSAAVMGGPEISLPEQVSSSYPPIDNIENKQRAEDDPPRLAGRNRTLTILVQDVVLAIRTTFRLLVDQPTAIRTRNRFVLIFGATIVVLFPRVFRHDSIPLQ